MQITLPAVLLSTALGLFWGLHCGYKKDSVLDKLSTTFQIVINTMPSFLIALVLMILFCFRQRWFPYTGLNSAGVAPGTATYLLDRMRHLILPVLTLTIAAAPSRYLLMRNTVSQVTEEKYVLYLMAQKDIVSKRAETSKLKITIESGKRRIQDLDKLIERIYEDQVLGNISAERYARMSVNYENEQRTLINKVAEDEIKSLMAKIKANPQEYRLTV